jgi:hypothetical protein
MATGLINSGNFVDNFAPQYLLSDVDIAQQT